MDNNHIPPLNELSEIESRYKAIIEFAVDAIITINEIGLIESFNFAAEKMFGYPAEEVIGHDVKLLMSQNYALHHSSYLQNYQENSRAKVVGSGREVLAKRKDGTEFPIELTVSNGRINNKRFFTGIIRDISSQRKVLNKLQEKQDRFLISQRFANFGIWDWDIRTGNVYWSEFVPPLFGLEMGEVAINYENIMQAIHPEDRDTVSQAIKICLQEAGGLCIEHRVIWPDGSVHWVVERGDVVRDEQGNPLRLIGVTQDNSAKKATEKELIRARQKAEEASKAKSQFLSSVSHELRTPLNAILGFTQLLTMDDNLLEEQQDSVNEISAAGSHLLGLINDILDLAKIEDGKVAFNIQSVPLAVLCEECMALISGMARDKGIEIEYDVDKVACLAINVDHIRAKQILLNLITNAIKYNRQGGKVSISCSTYGPRLRINIADTGVGIPQSRHHDVFKAFERLGAENSTIEGTGIGLVISKQLVQLLNGDIGFSSEEGKGSEFWVEFPYSNISGLIMSDDDPTLTHITPQHAQALQKQILHIEDNQASLRLLRQVIKMQGQWELHDASNGEQGLQIARSVRPDLILLDINLPDLNGFEVLKQIRNDPTLLAIPVIAISSNATEYDVHQGKIAGFTEYFTKPISIPHFLSVLARYL